jgi:hypothetical protein
LAVVNRALILLLILTLLVAGCSSDEQSEEQATPVAATPIVATDVAVATEQATPTEYPTPTQNLVPIDEVIEYEMKASFDFFWEQTNTDANSAGYGLVRDRYPGSEGVASIAAVGFALTAYPIGVEKGYITFEEGYERANGTMDTLLAMDREEGFYFHFVDMDTGERVWQSEVSSIDTAILVMGVLTAAEYFGDDVESKAQQLYDTVNWPWFLDESRQMFHMAYRPGEGFAGHWDFYAEQLMLYVLAAGSDTYPVDETPYYTFTRHYAAYGDGEPFIHSWFGSIFTYQYSHAWIDFRNYTDAEGVNWFDNSVEASLAHINFAVDNEDDYLTIGRNAWGLSASDGPDGYNGLYGAPPSGFDNLAHEIDDTIPPAGAIGSIIFTPEAAEEAMLNYYSIEPLNEGDYGFLDAYNLSEDWFATDVIGIDKGITLLMLANYQNDLVYEIVMQNEQLLNGLARLQITPNE